jgi:hypothetical protein
MRLWIISVNDDESNLYFGLFENIDDFSIYFNTGMDPYWKGKSKILNTFVISDEIIKWKEYELLLNNENHLLFLNGKIDGTIPYLKLKLNVFKSMKSMEYKNDEIVNLINEEDLKITKYLFLC